MRSLLLGPSSVLVHGSKNARPGHRTALIYIALVFFAALCAECGVRPAIAAASTVPNIVVSGQTESAADATDTRATQTHEMIYIHIGPESSEDHRYSYHLQVLKQALEKTSSKYGSYRIQQVDYMSEERQKFELLHQSEKLTVIIRGDTLEYEKIFEWVRIPIDKGLLGYRVFLIRSEDQPRLTHDTTLDDLRNFTIGQGNGWKDIEILRANRMKVMTGGDYAGLFAMLANRRFDLFSRGMTMMIEDGSFDRLFEAAHKDLLDDLHLTERRLFVLQNPLATPEPPADDSRYWYMPLKREEAKRDPARHHHAGHGRLRSMSRTAGQS